MLGGGRRRGVAFLFPVRGIPLTLFESLLFFFNLLGIRDERRGVALLVLCPRLR